MRTNLSEIGYKFLVYDGVNLSDHFIVRTFEMPMLPSVEASSVKIDGRAGEWYASRRYSVRDIDVGLGILNDTRDRPDALKTWLMLSDKLTKDKVCKLELGGGLYVNALLVGDTSMTTNGRWSIVNVTFRCFDPYIYGEEHTETLKAGANTLYIKGKCPTYPVLTLKATTTTVQVQDTDTTDRVRIPSTASGNNIVVDMGQHRCTLNDAYKPADPTVTDFWPLRIGENHITVTGASGTLTYREMYL